MTIVLPPEKEAPITELLPDVPATGVIDLHTGSIAIAIYADSVEEDFLVEHPTLRHRHSSPVPYLNHQALALPYRAPWDNRTEIRWGWDRRDTWGFAVALLAGVAAAVASIFGALSHA